MSGAGDTGRKVIALVTAYVAGLIVLMLAIAAADSRLASGIALAWIIGVLLYARRELRCPLCGASVLNANAGKGLRWLAGERRCPRCNAEWGAARAARSTAPGRRPTGRTGDTREKGT